MSFVADTFTFDGVPCRQYGLMLMGFGSSAQEDITLSLGDILEDRIQGRYRPLHYGIDYGEPLQFDLVFGPTPEGCAGGGYTPDRWDVQAIAGWLMGHGQYKWLTIDQHDLREVRFRCIVTELTPLTFGHIRAFRAHIRCDSPFAYARPRTWTMLTGETLQLDGGSTYNGWYAPTVYAAASASGMLRLQNLSDGERGFMLHVPETLVGQTITIDCEHQILSAATGENLYPYFMGDFLRLGRGVNELRASGASSGAFAITCEFPVMIGA